MSATRVLQAQARHCGCELLAKKLCTLFIEVGGVFKIGIVPHPIAGREIKRLLLSGKRLQIGPHLAPSRERVKAAAMA
ncbi:hypothetical protein SBV1_2540013 [Verrucomicrobia bacterium]|nr:hypothetical protein SBV1_2540013 [Verrucomicrobiota bacterium]